MLAHLLVETGDLDDQSSKYAASIASSTEAMSGMLADLLDFTNTRLGTRMEVSPAPLDLGSLCREVIEEMRGAHPARTFDYTPEGELSGHWDGGRLRQLISNLLGNAVQHGSSTTPIELRISATEAEVHLAVRNQGPPIPKDRQESIFEPMKRGAPSSRGRPHGSIGLGLYIAREVAAAHHGSIHVHSARGGDRLHGHPAPSAVV